MSEGRDDVARARASLGPLVRFDDYVGGDFIVDNRLTWLLSYDQVEQFLAQDLIYLCEDICNDEQDRRTVYHWMED